ncbi:TPA: DcrB-related protein [Serratia marcescens]
MSEITLQECAITVPDVFRDRTMNLFTLSNSGVSEFTFVISRATARAGDTLQGVSNRLAKALDTNLQVLTFIHGQLVGIEALKLFYSFKSGARTLYQKQRVVLVDEKLPGKKLLCFIGACQDAFDDYHTRVYDDITASIRFHPTMPSPAATDTQISSDSPGLFFTFDREISGITVFKGVKALYACIDLKKTKFKMKITGINSYIDGRIVTAPKEMIVGDFIADKNRMTHFSPPNENKLLTANTKQYIFGIF